MKVEMPHELELAEAMRRMQALTGYWRKKYAVESRWTKNVARMSGSFLGVTFDATLAVDPHAVVIDGPDPGVLLRSQAVGYLMRKLDQYLAAAAPAAGDERKGERRVPA